MGLAQRMHQKGSHRESGSFLTLGIFSVIIKPLDKDSDG